MPVAVAAATGPALRGPVAPAAAVPAEAVTQPQQGMEPLELLIQVGEAVVAVLPPAEEQPAPAALEL